MLKKLFKKLLHAFRGIAYALLNDLSFQIQVIAGGIIVLVFVYSFSPLSQVELLFLGLSWMLLLITELQNSSFEEALNKLHPELHDSIKRSKDMAAGAVLIVGFFLLFVMASIILL